MDIELKYGHTHINFTIKDKNVLGVLELPKENFNPIDPKTALIEALNNPIGTKPLAELIKEKKPKQIAVILEDITRPNHDYPQILSGLIEALKTSGIKTAKFIIAYGTHRKMTPEECLKVYGAEVQAFGELLHHSCDNKASLAAIGKMSNSVMLEINKTVAESDFIITTGNIEPHTFAGYGGGRKAILPGVSSRETITANHAQVTSDYACFGMLDKNPIHIGMLEAANLAAKGKTLFLMNLVRNDKKQLLKYFCGDLEKAFNAGVEFSQKTHTVPVNKLSDVTIVSSGGAPKDYNLYQAQKSINAAALVTRKSGTIVLTAQCRDGAGQEIFASWMQKYSIDEILSKKEFEIEVEGHRAYLTAKILKDIEILVISDMHCDKVKGMKFTYSQDINQALDYVTTKHGEDFKAYIIPNGAAILPKKV
ncbi:MAG: hypothetical protein A2252_12030 [Elusimicrobia bacterium RIFOXYA2_FULL_39_19]|nr:MAG: hypothetical protein A2252_12030 [Elusimicrobia bacterium RIFOXYA2_FULL_39_19]